MRDSTIHKGLGLFCNSQIILIIDEKNLSNLNIVLKEEHFGNENLAYVKINKDNKIIENIEQI